MSWKTDLIKAVATVKANTENHNGELKEFKNHFQLHKEAEEKDTLYIRTKMETFQCTISNFKCPHDDAITNIERRVYDNVKLNEKRRLSDLKEKADADRKIGERISSLEAGKKYNYLSMTGLWVTAGVVLKKIFTG